MERAEILADLKLMMSEYISAEDKAKLDTMTDDTNLFNELNIVGGQRMDILDSLFGSPASVGIHAQNG